MINNTHKNVNFLNQINGKIPRIGVIYQEKINSHDLCYPGYKESPYFLFYKLRIEDSRGGPHYPAKNKININSNPNEYVV